MERESAGARNASGTKKASPGARENAPNRAGAAERFSISKWTKNEQEELLSEGAREAAVSPGEEIVAYGAATKRIAVVNYDWSVITPNDLFLIARPFLPEGESIISVKTHKTPLGKAMLEKEEKEGPPIAPASESEEDVQAAIRSYLKAKLAYVYAVIEFSSKEAATAVYECVDSVELEGGQHYIDLRFVPEGHEIKDDLLEEVREGRPSKGRKIPKNSLYHTKVKLGWEEDEPRREYLRGLFMEEDIDLSLANDLIDVDGEMEEEKYQQLAGGMPSEASKRQKRERKPASREVAEEEATGKEEEEEEEDQSSSSASLCGLEDRRFAKAKNDPEYAIDKMDPAFAGKSKK